MNLDTSRKVFDHFDGRINPHQEEVWVAGLTNQLTVIQDQLIFRGTVDQCSFHPRDIFRFLISNNASCFVLVHNHPSGDPTPSFDDYRITKRLQRAAKLMQIAMIDHVIIASKEFFSFADSGYLRIRR